MPIILITPPPIYEDALLEANKAKGRGLDRTNERYYIFYAYLTSIVFIYCIYNVERLHMWTQLKE